MKSITTFSLLLFGILLTITSCKGPEEGCTNEFGSNFSATAEIDCCCEYNIDLIRQELVGSYFLEDEKGVLGTSQIDIKLDPNDENSVLIKDNFLAEFNATLFTEGKFIMNHGFGTFGDPIHERNFGEITKINDKFQYKLTTNIQTTLNNFTFLEKGTLIKQ